MIKSRFYWKQLSADGLLKDYKIPNGYYTEDLNPWEGYENEEEALLDLHQKLEDIRYGKPSSLVLLKVFNYMYE